MKAITVKLPVRSIDTRKNPFLRKEKIYITFEIKINTDELSLFMAFFFFIVFIVWPTRVLLSMTF